VILAASALACGDGGPPPPPVDSGVTDSTTIVDGGDMDTSPMADSGSDSMGPDATLPTCSGDCDPRGMAECGADAGVCALAAATPSCEMTVGTKAAGASCEVATDCLPGLACFAHRGGGVCAEVCCPTDGACGDDQRCTGTGILVDGIETDWWSCVGTRVCDVLDPADMCERGEGCYIVSPEGDTDCLRGGAGESGAACVEQNDCAAGYHCGGVTDLTCARICEIGATSGEGACPPTEGNCQAYPYSPDGSGVCTRDTTSTFR